MGKSFTYSLLLGLQIGATTLESSTEIPQKTWKGTTFDPAIPLLGVYPKDLKSAYYSEAAISMFIAARFIITKLWNPPRCPSTG